jgi:hypothetical protein
MASRRHEATPWTPGFYLRSGLKPVPSRKELLTLGDAGPVLLVFESTKAVLLVFKREVVSPMAGVAERCLASADGAQNNVPGVLVERADRESLRLVR